MNRGAMVMSQLVDACRAHEYTDLVVVHEHRGEPDGMVVCHLPFGPTAYFALSSVVMRHDLKGDAKPPAAKEAYPHLVFESFTTKLGERARDVLKYLFPAPRESKDSKRVMAFVNRGDAVSFRHYTYAIPRGPSSVELDEAGPRLEMVRPLITTTRADAVANSTHAKRARSASTSYAWGRWTRPRRR